MKLTQQTLKVLQGNAPNVYDSIVTEDRSRLMNFTYREDPPRKASVLLPLCHVNGEAHVLFTVRSSDLRSHRGEVSFPGGKVDKEDASPMHAALREVQEEIGFTHIKVLAELSPIPDKTLTTEVNPFVGVLYPDGDQSQAVPKDIDLNSLIINPQEVASVFTLSVRDLVANMRTELSPHTFNGKAPFWMGPNGERIWGLTAFVLYEFLTTMASPFFSSRL